MKAHSKTVAECDESELINLIRTIVPNVEAMVQNGDDAAVFQASKPVVASSDMLVENRHFKRAWSSGEDIGWRAAMQNFADIAAMGGRGSALIVALAMPPDTPITWLQALARGLASACDSAGEQWQRPVGIAGGDLTAGSEIVVSVTALGELATARPVLRSGAQVGDVVALCGTSGRSAAGLALAGPPPGNAPAGVHTCWQTYLRPNPPLHAASALANASAAMDVSDGLIRDAGRIATASGVSIDLDRLQADEVLGETARYLGGEHCAQLARRWQLSGGEDHSLLATFPPRQLPPGFQVIGTVHRAQQRPVLVDGQAPNISAGFDHFHR